MPTGKARKELYKSIGVIQSKYDREINFLKKQCSCPKAAAETEHPSVYRGTTQNLCLPWDIHSTMPELPPITNAITVAFNGKVIGSTMGWVSLEWTLDPLTGYSIQLSKPNPTPPRSDNEGSP